jgi:hypothetical protein
MMWEAGREQIEKQSLGTNKNWKPTMGMPKLTPDMRIAVSMEDISSYIAEIKQLLQDLGARAEVDNEQLARIATAVSEIQRIIPALLHR